MPKGSPELTAARKEEIVNACEKLYQTMSFKDITLKEIGNVTSFTRTSIYNYFHTKEEIFLAFLEREYDRWNEELVAIYEENDELTREELADKIARSLENRRQLLKLLAMNNYDMESYSRLECIVSFKRAFGASMRNMQNLLDKFCPEMSKEDKQDFIYALFPFMFGIYPYTSVTEKQKKAMKEVGLDFKYQSIYEIAYASLIRLLCCGEKVRG